MTSDSKLIKKLFNQVAKLSFLFAEVIQNRHKTIAKRIILWSLFYQNDLPLQNYKEILMAKSTTKSGNNHLNF